MFFYLEGNVVQKHDTFFVLDIQGVGFKIYTSHSTLKLWQFFQPLVQVKLLLLF